MNTYSAYKDSGEQWLGQIPAHWEMKPGLAVFEENKVKNSLGQENTVLSLSYGKIIVKENKNEGLVPTEYTSYQIVHPDYIIIRCTDLQNDKVSLRTGLVKDDGIITSAYLGLIVKTNNPAYIHYFLHALDITKELYRYGSGLRQSLSWVDFKRLNILLPPIEEQEKIVSYLDEQTAQIDSAIAREQKMIDLLEERKQIIIQQAVTKGLNPNAKMKDSGIEWIGEMPEHWDLTRLKFFLSLKSGDAIRQEQLKDVGDYPVYGGGAKIGYTNNYNAKKDEIIIGRVGAKCGCVTLLNEDSWATDNALIVKSNIDVRYLYYLLIACDLNKLNVSNAQPLITGSKIKNFHIPITRNKVEQNEIVTFLDEHLVKIDNTISCFERLIALLQERKQIIINEVVTGKIKVS